MPLNEQQNEEVKAANKSPLMAKIQESPLGRPAQTKPLTNPSQTQAKPSDNLNFGGKVAPELKPTVGENPENATNDKVIEAQKHLSEAKAHALSFAGKVGMNPYIYIRNKIEPLEQQLNAGIRTATLMKTILDVDKGFEPKA